MTDNAKAWATPTKTTHLEKEILREQYALQTSEKKLKDTISKLKEELRQTQNLVQERDAEVGDLKSQLGCVQHDLEKEKRETFRLQVENSSLIAVRVQLEESLAERRSEEDMRRTGTAELEATKVGLRLMAEELKDPARRSSPVREPATEDARMAQDEELLGKLRLKQREVPLPK